MKTYHFKKDNEIHSSIPRIKLTALLLLLKITTIKDLNLEHI